MTSRRPDELVERTSTDSKDGLIPVLYAPSDNDSQEDLTSQPGEPSNAARSRDSLGTQKAHQWYRQPRAQAEHVRKTTPERGGTPGSNTSIEDSPTSSIAGARRPAAVPPGECSGDGMSDEEFCSQSENEGSCDEGYSGSDECAQSDDGDSGSGRCSAESDDEDDDSVGAVSDDGRLGSAQIAQQSSGRPMQSAQSSTVGSRPTRDRAAELRKRRRQTVIDGQLMSPNDDDKGGNF